MPKNYTVAQGDTIFSIAHAHGFRSLGLILDAPENAGLKANPEQLVVGATVVIPDKQPLTVEVRPGQELKLTVKSLKAHLSLVLEDDEEHAYSGKRFRLRGFSAATFNAAAQADAELEGRTDADGRVAVSLPPAVKHVELTLWPSDEGQSETVEWRIALGAAEKTL